MLNWIILFKLVVPFNVAYTNPCIVIVQSSNRSYNYFLLQFYYTIDYIEITKGKHVLANNNNIASLAY